MINIKGDFSSYSVKNVEKAKQFYSEILGLSVKEEMHGLSIKLPDGAKVFLYPKEDHEAAKFTVLNFAVDNVEAAVADLKKQNVKFEHYAYPKTDADGISREAGGPLIAWFKDPSGNILSVLEERH